MLSTHTELSRTTDEAAVQVFALETLTARDMVEATAGGEGRAES